MKRQRPISPFSLSHSMHPTFFLQRKKIDFCILLPDFHSCTTLQIVTLKTIFFKFLTGFCTFLFLPLMTPFMLMCHRHLSSFLPSPFFPPPACPYMVIVGCPSPRPSSNNARARKGGGGERGVAPKRFSNHWREGHDPKFGLLPLTYYRCLSHAHVQ